MAILTSVNDSMIRLEALDQAHLRAIRMHHAGAFSDQEHKIITGSLMEEKDSCLREIRDVVRAEACKP